ncbi:MAG TPA: hypothetical protein EYP51_03085, partial [Thiotrichales bacterium]|nr:hypothetical protein [Thiotrichales bacterium]
VKLFPPRDVCLECEAPAQELYTFTGLGEVFSYTTIYDAPAGFEHDAPYMVIIIKLMKTMYSWKPTTARLKLLLVKKVCV